MINYKGLNAGEILNYKYNPKINYIEVKVFIKRSFIDLINKTTKFYKKVGVNIKAGLNGIKVQSSSLDSLVNGEIAFITDMKKRDNTKIYKLLDNDKLHNKTFEVMLDMNQSNGIKVGSHLIYKGITIGKVTKIILDSTIKTIIKIDKKYKYMFGKNSKLYLESFKAGLSGVKNPNSLIFGTNIYLIADKNDGFKKVFKVDCINPIPSYYKQGLRIMLKASTKGSLSINAPIYYKKIKIGNIEKIRLSKNDNYVEVFVFIDRKYSHLIKTNSKFYNTSIIAIKANLLGIKIKTGTFESMLKGGIEIVNPSTNGQKVLNGAMFKLYNNPKKEWFE